MRLTTTKTTTSEEEDTTHTTELTPTVTVRETITATPSAKTTKEDVMIVKLRKIRNSLFGRGRASDSPNDLLTTDPSPPTTDPAPSDIPKPHRENAPHPSLGDVILERLLNDSSNANPTPETPRRKSSSDPVGTNPRTSSRTPKPSSTREVKLNGGRIIIWDEIKDCIPPYETPGDDKKINEEINPLSPAYRDKIDQWETKDLNKRVISSPSFNVGSVTVKAEEIGLVLVILFLWAGAITLFINRWGKLRMLEPYQPAYTAPDPSPPPRPAPPQPPFININIQSTSSLSLNDNYKHSSPLGGADGGGMLEWCGTQEVSDYFEQRRNSGLLYTGLSGGGSGMGGTQSMSLGVERSTFMMPPLTSQRRVRSAVDLVSLVMQEKLNTTNTQFAATNV